MPVYEYTALDKSGKTRNGVIDADSQIVARQKLRGTGIFPVEVKETVARSAGEKAAGFSLRSLVSRVKSEEIQAMTRQLSTLLGSGIPLVASLEALIKQAESAPLKKVLSHIKESVNEGNSLTSSLSQHPNLFSNIYINMVRAGEASGSLDVVLDRLAEFGEHQQALRSRFKAALVYPIFMAFVGTAVLFYLITFIVPSITRIFTEMNQALPLPTIILINVSGFMRSFWWVLLLLIFGILFGIREFISRPRGRRMWDEGKLRLTLIGSINRKMALARFGRTLGSLLQSGVPLLTSLQIVRNIVNNVLIAEAMDDAAVEIREGKSLHSSLAKSRWFPPVVLQMLSVGEQSGELEVMLDKMAGAYEREVETDILGVTALIEPIMILFMGAIVLFIVVSILLPIFEMNQLVM
jgi:general secretion pathway protein F